MFTDFSLLQGETLYKKVTTGTAGSVTNGVYFPGTETTTYPTFTGSIEPYQSSTENLILPKGVSSDDVILLFTDDITLKVHSDLEGNAHKADIIYFEDPAVNTDAQGYTCWKRMEWDADPGMELLMTDNLEIVCIRQEKM